MQPMVDFYGKTTFSRRSLVHFTDYRRVVEDALRFVDTACPQRVAEAIGEFDRLLYSSAGRERISSLFNVSLENTTLTYAQRQSLFDDIFWAGFAIQAEGAEGQDRAQGQLDYLFAFCLQKRVASATRR